MADARVLRSRSIYRGRVIDLSVEEVELPNGQVCELELIGHPGAAAVVPVDADGSVLMVRQYRHATGGWLLEVPAGKLDGPEPPEACALREVEEETGFKPGHLEPLGWVWTTPGFTNERIWLFLATRLTPARQSLQNDEVLHVERLPLAQAVEMAARGEIHDSKSVCALLRAARRKPVAP